MACSRQPGVAPYLHFIEQATGERITQAEWHAIRQLAAAEDGAPLTRTRLTPEQVAEANRALAHSIYLDEGIEFGHPDTAERFDEQYDRLGDQLNGVTVTHGTDRALAYLSRNGVVATLANLREEEPDATTRCDRHGGAWGDDPTCERCTTSDGTPRLVGQPGPMGPGAACSNCGGTDVVVLADGDRECQDCGTVELEDAPTWGEQVNQPAPKPWREQALEEAEAAATGEWETFEFSREIGIERQLGELNRVAADIQSREDEPGYRATISQTVWMGSDEGDETNELDSKTFPSMFEARDWVDQWEVEAVKEQEAEFRRRAAEDNIDYTKPPF